MCLDLCNRRCNHCTRFELEGCLRLQAASLTGKSSAKGSTSPGLGAATLPPSRQLASRDRQVGAWQSTHERVSRCALDLLHFRARLEVAGIRALLFVPLSDDTRSGPAKHPILSHVVWLEAAPARRRICGVANVFFIQCAPSTPMKPGYARMPLKNARFVDLLSKAKRAPFAHTPPDADVGPAPPCAVPSATLRGPFLQSRAGGVLAVLCADYQLGGRPARRLQTRRGWSISVMVRSAPGGRR